MTRQRERGLHELYAADPERADYQLWGRRSAPTDRRGFLRGAGLATMSGILRASLPMARFMPTGLMPAALVHAQGDISLPGKDGLTVLSDRPVSAETPAHLLDDAVTPAERLFIRNNGLPPVPDGSAADDWRFEVTGEACLAPRSFSIRDLKAEFEIQSLQLQLECAGNGRDEFYPPAAGNQWTTGAVGCPRWTGVRLRDVLERCGIAEDAVYVAYYGADRHLADPVRNPISRGVPMAKALEDESLLAWAINDQPLPQANGYPLRLILGGWPGSVSGKWIKRIAIRDRVHDGEKMLGQSYRVPIEPVAPGTVVPDEGMRIIDSMPVKSLVTYPRSGITHAVADELAVRGHAWAGDLSVAQMFTSIDFGTTWQPAALESPANRLAWQHFSTGVRFPQTGYYEVWARAVDSQGQSQPMVIPGWNPRGYLNNACHRVAVRVV
jgi:DMSO/TMAO reductase YedYZ molybdopterin-dependent catalytic subunit